MEQNKTREWVSSSILAINADFNRSADTHLITLELPLLKAAGIDIYLKDESTHPSGSLKHRLARSLFLYGLCNGKITKATTIIEASSGSTAISEAYFARLLGLPFIAVVPNSTAPEKIKQIEFYGGHCVAVKPSEIYGKAAALALELDGYYMDQFTNAERATDWRGNNNIADSLFSQMEQERHPIPSWVVMSAGTGGTTATIGRYIRYSGTYCNRTMLCAVDPENSVFHSYYLSRDKTLTNDQCSRIEGIGRPRVEPSFLPDVIDNMISVPDAASIAALYWLEQKLGRKCGGSTGTNLYGAVQLAADMLTRGERGSIVTLICDSGERYLESYYNQNWVKQEGLNTALFAQTLAEFDKTGKLQTS